jgi:hypothetical protein
MTSISSSSLHSTRRLTEGGGRTTPVGASAVSGALVLTDDAARTVGTTRASNKSCYNGFAGRTRAPLLE